MACDTKLEQISDSGDTMSTAPDSPRSPPSPLSKVSGRWLSGTTEAGLPIARRRAATLRPLDLTGLGRRPSAPSTKGPGPPQATGYDGSELIGSGSISKVYKVTRRSDQYVFAAKHVCVQDEEVRRLTHAEYTIMASLKHENIVGAEGFYESGNDFWMFIEWCSDGCLQQRVTCYGSIEEEQSRPLLLQLVEGLDYLHQKRIIHRDLKPDNIYLHHDATVLKIGDFNSAKQLEGGAACSAMLTHRGTPLYAAPEVRFARQWNERVDVWAIGLIAFFMLQSALPFNQERPQVRDALKSGVLPEICWSGVTQDCKSMILQCLEVDMRQRPAPMELRQHAYFLGEPVDAELPKRERRRTRTMSLPTAEP